MLCGAAVVAIDKMNCEAVGNGDQMCEVTHTLAYAVVYSIVALRRVVPISCGTK